MTIAVPENASNSSETRKIADTVSTKARITDAIVKALPKPAKGSRITYDAEVKGFGIRVTAAGARAFVLNYRVAGRERRYTIGAFPNWSATAARGEAKRLKRETDAGHDPLGRRGTTAPRGGARRADG